MQEFQFLNITDIMNECMSEQMNVVILSFVLGYLRTYAKWLRHCAKYYLLTFNIILTLLSSPLYETFLQFCCLQYSSPILPMRGTGVKFKRRKRRLLYHPQHLAYKQVTLWSSMVAIDTHIISPFQARQEYRQSSSCFLLSNLLLGPHDILLIYYWP